MYARALPPPLIEFVWLIVMDCAENLRPGIRGAQGDQLGGRRASPSLVYSSCEVKADLLFADAVAVSESYQVGIDSIEARRTGTTATIRLYRCLAAVSSKSHSLSLSCLIEYTLDTSALSQEHR